MCGVMNWRDTGVAGSQPAEQEQQNYGDQSEKNESLGVFLIFAEHSNTVMSALKCM